jgi:hypothetical protein
MLRKALKGIGIVIVGYICGFFCESFWLQLKNIRENGFKAIFSSAALDAEYKALAWPARLFIYTTSSKAEREKAVDLTEMHFILSLDYFVKFSAQENLDSADLYVEKSLLEAQLVNVNILDTIHNDFRYMFESNFLNPLKQRKQIMTKPILLTEDQLKNQLVSLYKRIDTWFKWYSENKKEIVFNK